MSYRNAHGFLVSFRSDSSFNFMVFFFVFFFQLMVSGVHAIGINNLGVW